MLQTLSKRSMPGRPLGLAMLICCAWPAGATAGDELEARKPWVSIVEMPSSLNAQLAGRRPERAHHGLRFGGESQTRALRSMGFAVSDCSTQLRVPTKVTQNADGVQANVRAEMRFGCRF